MSVETFTSGGRFFCGVLSTSKTEQLGKAVVKTVNNFPDTLEDIADVTIGPKAPKLGTASERGKSAVLMTITKQPATSTVADWLSDFYICPGDSTQLFTYISYQFTARTIFQFKRSFYFRNVYP